jgi:putative NIF3 family GTP cyclohydrolase 1 type 2
MTASDILEHFLSVGDWVDREKTVDRIIAGDPHRPVRRALVTWMSTFEAARAAAARGCQLIVTHEPTFWEHRHELDHLAQERDPARRELGERKRRFIEEQGMVVLRCHDVWDAMPEVGIPWAWARFLGLGSAPAAAVPHGYMQRYDIPPVGLDAFAQRVAARTATIGEPAVQVVGDPEQMVSKVGIGTGCYCQPAAFQQLGCDLSITCDDGNWYWREIQCAADAGHAIIRVNHGTSEEPGMVTLAQYLRRTFPDIEVEHLPHGSCFRLVGA